MSTSHGKTCAAIIILTLLGLLGNMFGFPVGFSVNFLFGSIFVILALYFFGTVIGVGVALVTASYTFTLWNHPYAIVIFTAEALWLGLSLRKKDRNIIIADTLYWLMLGLPLVWLFYFYIMSLGFQSTLIIALKQCINGIFNALIATLLIRYLPLKKFTGRKKSLENQLSLANSIFHLTAAFLMIPTLTILFLGNQRELKTYQQTLSSEVAAKAEEVTKIFDAWLEKHLNAIRIIADLGQASTMQPSAELQKNLSLIKRSFPDFYNLYIADARGETVAFFPEINEKGESTIGLNFADREYFHQLQNTLKPYISNVFRGRGGVFQPIFTITVPIVKEKSLAGLGLGAIDLHQLQNVLAYITEQKEFSLTIYDDSDNIVVSTKATRQPLQKFHLQNEGQIVKLNRNVNLLLPRSKQNISIMDIWREAIYFQALPLKNTRWTLLTELSIAPVRAQLYKNTIFGLALVLSLYLLAIIISWLVGRAFARNPSRLAAISSDLPAKIKNRTTINWPVSNILEMAGLINNFKAAADTLQSQFSEIQQNNAELEDRVRARTDELQELNQTLEARIEIEVEFRRRNEQLLIQQSKLAAMGEMIGAIAHQWRQPLNVLALSIQNLQDAYIHNDLSPAQMQQATEKSMNNINLMSRTIDDFRDFFRTDKKKTVFEVMPAVNNVFHLIGAQLNANDITYETIYHTDRQTITAADIKNNPSLFPKCPVLGFKNEFEHVILNIIANAKNAILQRRKTSTQEVISKGRIVVNFFRKKKTLIVKFKDNGTGIPESIRNRIFEPYFTTSPDHKGTGLGLYMSKIMIEEHMEGRIYLENCSDGALICIRLPIALAEDEET
ncbi:MAG: hypothetical protein JXR80_00035 [Deltaproteobacteria bacterium]|nr:hypothetical protein [Deltaproteobacteria bacterium]